MAAPELSVARRKTIRCLRINALTASVVERFRAEGIRSVLLKGPAIGQWLYQSGELRAYGDIDLLVAPDQFAQAESVLREAGFRELQKNCREAGEPASHHVAYASPEGLPLELHRSFHWLGERYARVWEELTKATDRLLLGGVEVEIPCEGARCLLLTLHAAAHGREFSGPLRDLARACELADDAAWTEAAALAQRLACRAAMGSGLRLVAPGRILATRLGLPDASSPEMMIHAASSPGYSGSLERLARIPRTRDRVAYVGRKLVPTPAVMRARHQLGDRGTTALVVAYLRRLARLPRELPVSLRAWNEARSAQGGDWRDVGPEAGFSDDHPRAKGER